MLASPPPLPVITGEPPDAEAGAGLPEPSAWLLATIRRRLITIGAVLAALALGVAAGVAVPIGAPLVLAVHLALLLGVRPLVPRLATRADRLWLVTWFLAAESWVLVAGAQVAGATLAIGGTVVLLQALLATVALGRRRAVMVLGAALAALALAIVLEGRGVIGPPDWPNLPGDQSGARTAAFAGALAGGVYLLYAMISAAAFRDLVEQTTRRLADREAAYRSTLAALRDVVFRVDADGRWTFLSPAWEGLTGQPVMSALGRHALTAFHPDDHPLLRDAMRPEVARTQPLVDARLAVRDGRWTPVEVRLQALPHDAEAGRVFGTIADMSDRTAREQERATLARLDALGRLAGGIAHDVNNVLTTIQAQADALDHAVRDDLRPELRPIHAAVARGAHLTRQLLSFSRRQEVVPTVVELRQALHAVEDVLQRMAGGGATVVLDAPAATWARTDPLSLEEVVGCLVTNAAEAAAGDAPIIVQIESYEGTTAPATPTVGRLGAAAAAIVGDQVPAGRWRIVRVRDSGTGISPDLMPRIFEPFFTTRGRRRTGLGLAAAHGVVQQLGGRIRIASTLGIGTTCEVFLPAAEAPAGVSPEQPAELPDVVPGTTALVVEDEETLRFAVRRMLEKRGYVVREAANGREGIAAIERDGLPAIIVSDVVMPELGGREMMRHVRAMHPEARVLFMSGFTAAEMGNAGGALDGAPLLQKPFTAKALYVAIDRLLRPAAAG